MGGKVAKDDFDNSTAEGEPKKIMSSDCRHGQDGSQQPVRSVEQPANISQAAGRTEIRDPKAIPIPARPKQKLIIFNRNSLDESFKGKTNLIGTSQKNNLRVDSTPWPTKIEEDSVDWDDEEELCDKCARCKGDLCAEDEKIQRNIEEYIHWRNMNSSMEAKLEEVHNTNRLQRLRLEKNLRRDTSKDKVPVKAIPLSSSSSSSSDIYGNKIRISSSSENQVIPAPDLMCDAEDEVCCGEGEHYECERHSHTCIDGIPPDAPCDCCRHGHTLSSLIRTDDCKSCNRNVSGCHVSPKYPQIRQRMLKALNQRRDNSEETELKNTAPSSCRSNTKREVITTNNKTTTEDVDALVRMIEGTDISADPKKAAKKARQKERKLQIKIDEERKREDEERRKREEEERLRKEKEQQEEEERRKAEDIKKLARKAKKKNRKKRAAANTADPNFESKSSVASEVITGHSLQIPEIAGDTVLGGNNISPKVNLFGKPTALDGFKQNPVPDSTDKKSDMVTIRRHPSQPESVVTISLKGKHGGEDLLYYLINGQIYRNDDNSGKEAVVPTEGDSLAPKPSKKKKKKGKTSTKSNDVGQLTTGGNTDEVVKEFRETSSEYSHSDKEGKTYIDLSKLKLPPGITITKVNSLIDQGLRKKAGDSISCGPISSSVKEPFTPASENCNHGFDSGSGVIVGDRDYVQHCMMEEDLFAPTENEEFEEVISTKTRRQRNKAAKTKELDGPSEDQESVRSSPCSGVSATYYSRRAGSSCDKPVENGLNKRTNVCTTSPLKQSKTKASRSNGNSKCSSGLEKACPISNGRREQSHRSSDLYHGSMTMGANVMPRIARAHAKNVESSTRAGFGNEGHFHPHVVPHSSTVLDVGNTMGSHERNENVGFMPETPCHIQYLSNNTCHIKKVSNEMSQPVLELSGTSHPSSHHGLKLWDQGERHTTSLGPFTRQADSKDESWSPWKDYSWTEGSTPENPSPRFGMESTVNSHKCSQDLTSSNFSFQELKRIQTGKSPIQRPVPTTPETCEGNSVHQDSFSPQLCSASPYSGSPYYAQISSGRSHHGLNDLNYKRSYGGPLQKDILPSMKPSDDNVYNSPDNLSTMNLLHLRDQATLNSRFSRNDMVEENPPFDSTTNLYKSRTLDPSYIRLQTSTNNFVQNRSRQNTIVMNNQQWSGFSENRSPVQVSDVAYDQNHACNIPIQQASVQNNWSMNQLAAFAWVNQQEVIEGINTIHGFEDRTTQLNPERQKSVGHLNSQVSPQMPSSERMNWDNGTA